MPVKTMSNEYPTTIPRLREVTEKEFYAALYADTRDIMPRVVSEWSDEAGYTSEWRTNDGRQALFGRSSGNTKMTYELVIQ